MIRVGAVGTARYAAFQVPCGRAFFASAGTAASIRPCILRRWCHEATFAQDRKMIHRGLPVDGVARPM